MAIMMKAISNTSPIIGLSIIDHLELLWELFDIYIPQEVYNEVINESSDQAIGKHDISKKLITQLLQEVGEK
jgi:predicted nucleic acid-binding protein